ncbi:hypothetical protein TIFTF001_017562 [Ficus carica]|uniref:Uncharacterized protein n=1 Tax=Ficus carica TaxID=3494 RepID=A0AA88AAV3_FICCA|nr:hypothetical protein TIFTF001_017562 [Ficus carica]
MATLDHPTVIVIVVIFVGCVIFVTFLAAALFCFLKKRKKSVQETGMIHLDEHKKIKEAIVEGPHGIDTLVLSVEDDIHIDGDIKKSERVGEGLHAKSVEGNASTTSGPSHGSLSSAQS